MANSMEQTARTFFEACEDGQGWGVCSQYCHANASFSAQAEPLTGVTTLEAYVEWAKSLYVLMPDASYDLIACGADEDRNAVLFYSVFSATHTGEGGPVPPTGKSTKTDYVYVMFFEDGKIRHMTKIWHAGLAMKDLGWA